MIVKAGRQQDTGKEYWSPEELRLHWGDGSWRANTVVFGPSWTDKQRSSLATERSHRTCLPVLTSASSDSGIPVSSTLTGRWEHAKRDSNAPAAPELWHG